MQFVVRFDRTGTSTGPDAVVITASQFTEAYREGMLVAYHFFDEEGAEVAMVRAAQVTYIAIAGIAAEPRPPTGPFVAPDVTAALTIGEDRGDGEV